MDRWGPYGRSILDGMDLELEGRDLNYGRTGGIPKLRQDTIEGAATYHWRQFVRLQPYVKCLIGVGSMDFPNSHAPIYTDDDKKILVAGGGVEYQFTQTTKD